MIVVGITMIFLALSKRLEPMLLIGIGFAWVLAMADLGPMIAKP